MARYQVILAYDGSQFQGFQRQSRSDTVQGAVEASLRELGWDGRSILAAGRTDAGVHAIGQVIAFDFDWMHSVDDLQAAMNACMPPSISVQAVAEAHDSFHPRYDAQVRCYRYHIFCQPVRHPLRERYAWRVWPAVDVDRMVEAANLISGRHDFAAFGSPPRAGSSTLRTVFRSAWRLVDGPWEIPDLAYEIAADGFLFRMVRRLVYLQIAIGQGRMEPEEVARHLETPPVSPIQGLAPPNGLILVRVDYDRVGSS